MRIVCGSVLAVAANAAAFADFVDVTISESGTTQFEAGSSHGFILNNASGAVTLESSGGSVEADAVSFTNFNAVANANTTFSGGWWDFGVLAEDVAVTNFFAYPSSAGGRTTTLDNGAVVTNVGCVFLAGASGTDNTLELKGGSSMTVRKMVFGVAQGPQRSKCVVTNGASLHCLGMLTMSEGSARDNETKTTDNLLTVSGEGSSLVVDGTTYLGRDLGYNYNGGLGGSTLEVTDGASADFNGIVMCDAVVHGRLNHVVFSRGAKVNMKSFTCDYHWSSTAKPSSNLVEVLSGAVVTNTGALTMGYNDSNAKSHAGNSIVISNATLVTKAGTWGSSTGFLVAPDMTARLSGADAKLVFTSEPVFMFTEVSKGTFIVENHAIFNWPSGQPYFGMNGNLIGKKFIVRDGAKVTVPNGFKTCSSGHSGSNNVIVVERDGWLAGSGVIAIAGKNCTMEVVDGKVTLGYYLYVGHNGDSANNNGTNGLLRVAGTHPSIRPSWRSSVRNGSKIRIELPESGYDEGYANSTNAVVYVIANGEGFYFDASSSLELTGAEAMLEYHRAHNKKKSEYYLMGDGTPASYILSDEKMAEVQATLPDGMTLCRKTAGNREHLILSVKPKWGMSILFR